MSRAPLPLPSPRLAARSPSSPLHPAPASPSLPHLPHPAPAQQQLALSLFRSALRYPYRRPRSVATVTRRAAAREPRLARRAQEDPVRSRTAANARPLPTPRAAQISWGSAPPRALGAAVGPSEDHLAAGKRPVMGRTPPRAAFRGGRHVSLAIAATPPLAIPSRPSAVEENPTRPGPDPDPPAREPRPYDAGARPPRTARPGK